MPQMAPLSWTILFFTFSMLFIMMLSMNFFMKTPSLKKNKNVFSLHFKHWKW